MSTTNWFDQDGGVYARFRPDYPEGVTAFLADVAPDTRVAVDVGCGNGQLSVQLASRFVSVIASDPSIEQIAHAVRRERVRYAVGAAEAIDVGPASVSLVTAAQAAHWFDRPRFYDEARRVLVPRGVVALITYGVPELEDELSTRFNAFYRDEVGPYWPPERKLVDSGYAEIAFPFEEITPPALAIERDWDVHAFLGYVSSWSATRRAREANAHAMLTRFADELVPLWGAATRRVIWPIRMRVGRV